MGRLISRKQLITELEAETDSLRAILAVPEAIDALCAPGVFGPGYRGACESRLKELTRIIRLAKRGTKCAA
jgi:hypothetical protein